ncbi:MAG: signal recognition particle-docking protein FtsY [archaeon]|nr:signal recognition particle-docking protein FtsY [archaeon]
MFGLLKKKLNEAIQKVSDTVVDTGKAASDTLDRTTVSTKKAISGTVDGTVKAVADKKIVKVVTEKKIDEKVLADALWELELALLENNVASDISEKICGEITDKLSGKPVNRFDIKKTIEDTFRDNVREILERPPIDIYSMIDNNKNEGKPTLIIFLGFNGAGKTTNLAKLGHHLKEKGYSCVFAAGDTFRAAAIHQLEVHANSLKIPIIKHDYGSDSAAVIFDAVKHARAKSIDVVLADTAGRTHMDKNLLEELKKITRVNHPDLSLLVVESIAGNDIVEQGKVFSETGVDGIVLSKWDVDQKGGAALSLTKAIDKPIVFLGVGQNYNDLKDFDIEKVMESII